VAKRLEAHGLTIADVESWQEKFLQGQERVADSAEGRRDAQGETDQRKL
jgi:uncharacterized DUF497 family protein